VRAARRQLQLSLASVWLLLLPSVECISKTCCVLALTSGVQITASHVLEISSLHCWTVAYYGRPTQQMRTLYFHPVVSFFFFLFSSFYLFSSPNLGRRRFDVYHTSTWCGLSANLGRRSETCCTLLAVNTGRKKVAKNSPSAQYHTNLSGLASTALIDNRKRTS